jgi:hypothetical protein
MAKPRHKAGQKIVDARVTTYPDSRQTTVWIAWQFAHECVDQACRA